MSVTIRTYSPKVPSRARARLADSPAALVFAAAVVASVVGRAVAALAVDGVWIAPDEMIYASLGRSLWGDGTLSVFGVPGVYTVLYPALIGLPLTVLDAEAGLAAAKVLQAVVMSLAAVPVYRWSRRLAAPEWALLAAALTLAVPALVYTGLLMSEAAFYPVVALAAYALAAALEHPTRGRQAVAVLALVLAGATRLQGLVLVPAFATAVVANAAILRDPRRIVRLAPALAAMALLGAGWVAYRAFTAGSATAALGAYAVVAERDYDPAAVARFLAYHAADVVLFTAVVPVCALALLALDVARRRDADPALAAYVATALALVGWFLGVSAAFASEYVGRLAERTLVGVAPVLFVGLAAWLGRGAPRPRVATGLVVVAATGLVLMLPLRDVVVPAALPDAFTLVPLLWLREAAGEEALELTVWGAVAGAAALVALLPRRAVAVVPLLGLAWLSFASFAATREVAQNVAFDERNLLGGRHGWIDAAARGPVGYLYAGDPANLVWQELFWNERLRSVYLLAGREPPEGLPLAETAAVRPDGALTVGGRPPAERWMVARSSLNLVGTPVDEVDLSEYEITGLRLWRLEPPARLSWFAEGIRENGDMHEPGTVTAYDCARGRLELTLLPKGSSTVELRVNGRVVQRLDLAGQPYVNATVFPPADARLCRFEIVPDGFLGSTRVEFVRG